MRRRIGFGSAPVPVPVDERAEDRWERLVSQASRRMERERFEWETLDPAVIAASRRPALRQLFPTMSMKMCLMFSRCTRFPFSTDLPRIVNSGEFAYTVYAGFPSQAVLGSGDADYVADLVVEHLPQDCGPAFVGSVDELAAQIAATEGVAVANVRRRLHPLPSDIQQYRREHGEA
jgi:hypothetical protein